LQLLQLLLLLVMQALLLQNNLNSMLF